MQGNTEKILKVIVGAQLRSQYKTQVCGPNHGEASSCSFFIEKVFGEVVKVADWPNEATKIQYPESGIPNNLYIQKSIMLPGDETILFETHFEEGCSYYDKQQWSLNITNGTFLLKGTERVFADQC